jgi:hypothetical protein
MPPPRRRRVKQTKAANKTRHDALEREPRKPSIPTPAVKTKRNPQFIIKIFPFDLVRMPSMPA